MTSTTTITERVAEMHAAMAAQSPNQTMGAFAREQAELAASAPAGIAPAGTVLPDTELLDVHGTATTLSAAAGGSTSVLVFYRGAWCPYCNMPCRPTRRSCSRSSPRAASRSSRSARRNQTGR